MKKPNRNDFPDFFSRQVGEARRFYQDFDPPKHKPIAVVCAGLEHCAPDYVIKRQKFPYWCIEYVLRGTGSFNEHALAAGSVFAYGPEIEHKIVSDARRPLVKYFVTFTGRRAIAVLRASGLETTRSARVFPPDAIAALFDELVQSGLRWRTDNDQLCCKLLECLALKIGASATTPDETSSSSFAVYLECRSIIERNFLRLRTLEQISSECGVDSAQICRLFRRFDTRSPYQYLLKLKMNHAAEELQRPGILIKDVAARAGYRDSFHFSRLFHKVLGLSPAEFRKLRSEHP